MLALGIWGTPSRKYNAGELTLPLGVINNVVLCEGPCNTRVVTTLFGDRHKTNLRVALVHDSAQVRAAALRALRYLMKEERDVRTLNRLQYPFLIAR
uniref:Rapamycin-insensitive companion of mTOR N-terminal domain-containing protein n=1 Tax=Timema shepardi TaxID=629360 RepID=A0A7R9BCE8_TIMSH|nr:unnamed protein product [Timema shepardi]